MSNEKLSNEAHNPPLRKGAVIKLSMKNFGCFALISDGFATEGCSKQCEECKIRYPEPKEKMYVNYYKSVEDWRRGVFTEKEFENEQEAIDFWHLVTNNNLGETRLSREKRYKINSLPGDFC